MNGHQQVISMRMQGQRPQRLMVFAGPVTLGAVWEDGTPCVDIPPSDNLERLDLRFMVGLPVEVIGGEELFGGWLGKVTRACIEAGAKPVFVFGDSRVLELRHG